MRHRTVALGVLAAGFLLSTGCAPGEAGTSGSATQSRQEPTPHVTAESPVQAGAYLVEVAGCNDCHTPGYLQKQGDVPQSEWLTGTRIGYRGPWGTTYPKNLRRTVRRMSEDRWVELFTTRDQKPPMPWFNLHAMSERDSRAIYRFIETLGEAGDSVPAPLPPGEEPRTPLLRLRTEGAGGIAHLRRRRGPPVSRFLSAGERDSVVSRR